MAQDLEHDARVFGQRMTEQATELNRLACKGEWEGDAADVFKEHLKTLPRDLERCGEAFTGLADALVRYGHIYEVAKRTTVADLERRAVEARNKLQLADMAFHTTTISAPTDCSPPAPDRKPLDDAHDALGAILREAHDFAEKFNDSADIQQLEHIIRKTLTEYAPDQPRWHFLKQWAGEVFKLTGIDTIHQFINRYAEFFNSLAGFLSELSGVIGILALPAMFFPPLGEAMGVAILGLTAASAGIKTSLYAGHARDHNGKLLVKGGDLIHAYVDVGLSAAAVGGVAGVERARILKGRGTTTFGEQVARQFSKDALKEAIAAPRKVITDAITTAGANAGRKAVAKVILRDGVVDFSSNLSVMKGVSVKNVAWGGVVVGGAAPFFNAEHPLTDWNVGGWQSVRKFPHETMELGQETKNLLPHEPETPDLHLKVQPTIGQARTPPTKGPAGSGPVPVMGNDKEL